MKRNVGRAFFIEGDFNNHFCWELLDSNATYLWSFNKSEADIKVQFQRLEKTINIIIDTSRKSYKKDFKSKKIDSDLIFYNIDHSNINSASEKALQPGDIG